MLKGGAGHLSIQSGDISYAVSESDVEILLSRDGNDVVSQSQSTYGSHDDSVHQEVGYKLCLLYSKFFKFYSYPSLNSL